MKKFTPEDIKNRHITQLKTTADWPVVLMDSAVESLVNADAEMEAELARYFEYLLTESKWGVARNLSSLITQSQYLGYKLPRKISSTGSVVFSHNILLQSAGTLGVSDIFTLDDCATYLTDPYAGPAFTISKGTKVMAGGIPLVVSQDVVYAVGTKYVSVPVVQGIWTSTTALLYGNSFEKVRINKSTVESASTSLTSGFFSVSLTIDSTSVPCIQYEDIYLAEYNEYAYDVNTTIDRSAVVIRFGNGIVGKRPPAGTIANITYLETLGENGNVSGLYTANVITSVLPTQMYCTNFSGVLGGRAEASIDEIRKQAPTQYLEKGGIITTDAYIKAIESIPAVLAATAYYGVYTNMNVTKDCIFYSAIDIEGNAFDYNTIQDQLDIIVEGKNNPFDYYRYEDPKFLHLKLNVTGYKKNSTPFALNSSVKEGLLAKYGSLQQDFFKKFDYSELISYVWSQYEVEETSLLLEAVTDLYPSTFYLNNLNVNYYMKDFSFDKSFQSLKGFSDGVQYCLKVNVYFDPEVCPECVDKSRTLFVVKNGASYRLLQYPYIPEITSTTFMRNYVLKTGVAPEEITPENSSTTEVSKAYIDFKLNIDLSSLSPSSLGDLAVGTFQVPVQFYINGTYQTYINFENPDHALLNKGIKIQVIGEPTSYIVNPLYDNNIIKIDEADITVEVST